jgi:hypothetical protein
VIKRRSRRQSICFGVEDAEALAKAFASSGAVFSVKLRTMPMDESSMYEISTGYILGFIQPSDTP